MPNRKDRPIPFISAEVRVPLVCRERGEADAAAAR